MKKLRKFLMLAAFAVSATVAFAFKPADDMFLIENGTVILYTGQAGSCVPEGPACFYSLKSGAAENSTDPNDYEPVPGHENETFQRQ
jgi:hypothetical protein